MSFQESDLADWAYWHQSWKCTRIAVACLCGGMAGFIIGVLVR